MSTSRYSDSTLDKAWGIAYDTLRDAEGEVIVALDAEDAAELARVAMSVISEVRALRKVYANEVRNG